MPFSPSTATGAHLRQSRGRADVPASTGRAARNPYVCKISGGAGLFPSPDIEYRIVRSDGEIRWVRVRGFQVRDTAHTLIRLTGIVTDITDRQRAAEALQTSLEEISRANEALRAEIVERK